MSLLTIVQQTFGEIGLAPPSAVIGNTDANVVKALYLTNRAGLDIRDIANAAEYWPVLRKQFLFNLLGIGPFSGTFTPGSNIITNITGTNLAGVQIGWQISSRYALNDTMVVAVNAGAGTVTMSQNANLTTIQGAQVDTQLAFGQEAYPVPADLNYFIPQTGWDRNFRWQLLGPVNAQEWQVLKSGISPVGPRLRYRLMGSGNSTAIQQSPSFTNQTFTATAGQTVFGLSQIPQSLFLVSLDGAVLTPGVDYTFTTNTITLTNGALAGQTLYAEYVTPLTNTTTVVGTGPVQIFINPAPYVPTGQSSPISDLIVMEYASINWVAQSSAPTSAVQTAFLADTDVSVLPEDMIILSLKWRMLRALGQKYGDEATDYQDYLDRATGRQTMGRNLPMNARASGIRLLNAQNVPDTNFGS